MKFHLDRFVRVACWLTVMNVIFTFGVQIQLMLPVWSTYVAGLVFLLIVVLWLEPDPIFSDKEDPGD